MGGFWSSQVEAKSAMSYLGNDEHAWKEYPEYVALVEKLRQESSAIRELNDEQVGIILICTQSCSDAGHDSRKLAEVCINIAQAESSAKNISREHPRSSELGVFQQNELFGQRDNKDFWKEKLSKEDRLDIKDCVDRMHRTLNKEQNGDKDWRKGDFGEVSYKLQRCEPKNKAIYSDPKRIEVATKFAKVFYPDHRSMLEKLSPESQEVPNSQDSNAVKGRLDVRVGPRYTGRVDSHSVVDAFKARGWDSSFENRASVGAQLKIEGTPGTAKYNTELLRQLT